MTTTGQSLNFITKQHERNIYNLRRSVVTIYVYRVDYAVIRLEYWTCAYFDIHIFIFSAELYFREPGNRATQKAKQGKEVKQSKQSERQGFLPVRRCTSLDLMAPLLLTLLTCDLQVFLLSMWLDVTCLANLDAALTSHDCRPYWMMLLHCLRSADIDEWGHNRHCRSPP